MTTGRRLGRRGGMRVAMVVAAAVVAGAVAPAGAGAVEVRIKDNLGNPTPVAAGTNATVRQLAEELTLGFAADEAKLKVSAEVMFGPTNVLDLPVTCRDVTGFPPTARPVRYAGNGLYTVNVRLYAQNSSCTGTPVKQETFQYTVNAFTALASPAPVLLTRKPGDFAPIQYPFGIDINPGANWAAHDVWYALNAQPNPDAGVGKQAFVDPQSPVVPVRFQEPGQYTFMARAKGTGGTLTPWSQPLSVKVKAPFDFKSRFLTWTDNRGPSYRVRVRVREPGARGKVTFRLAGGKKRGRYRRIGTARISRRGAITKRFKVRRTGNYRLRISYKGNDLVAGGHVTFRVRFKRRIIFRSSASSVG